MTEQEIIDRFLVSGGTVQKVPRSKRALTDRHFHHLVRNDLANAASYDAVRRDRLADAAGRRAQRRKSRRV